ncbi:MAG TPA: saccharopine dehydrogenase C-terminal domain-containing protein [Longimicrobiales bacterium]|nr:saccharopine dehydrogenase C-terminal domain-containing protein [Longimicrobiales bacterium]
MRMLVLGAGLQGSACAYDLLQDKRVERVVVGDVRLDRIPSFLEALRSDPRLELRVVDARDSNSLRSAMSGVDACMNALPYYFNLEVSKLCVEAGVHCCDLGGNTAIVFEQMKLDDAANAKNVSIIPDCGLAPGMVNILAEAGIRELDQAESVRMYVGGLPQAPEPPLNYKVVYSLEGVLDYYTTPSWVMRDGQPAQVDALSEVESVKFPEPAGALEAFHTAGGLSTMATRYQGRIRTMEYKTLRYPGHADIMRAVRGLGLLELTPINVDGQTVIPRALFIAAAEPHLRKPHSADLVALRVTVEGKKDGIARKLTYDLLDFMDEAHGISAMERTTGFSLAITGSLQAQRLVNASGVQTPDLAMPAELYIEELARRGIRIEKRVE